MVPLVARISERVLGACFLLAVFGPGFVRAVPAAEMVRLRATADVWVSDANSQERNTSSGKHSRLKLKTVQEMALVRFDAGAAAGREVLGATLFLRRATSDKLRYLRVSTVNQDWVEGESRVPYGPPNGATFLYADATADAKRPWAWPGSSLADVIMTSGNSLACTAVRKELDGRWISVPIKPRLVYAMAVGDSDGLAIMDGGNPAYANNFIHSTQAKGSEPYIEVRLGKPLAAVPPAPAVATRPAPERAHLESGAIRLSIGPAEDVFCWRVKLDGKPVERWRVKHPARGGPTVFYLEDLAPSKQYALEVVAVSPGGKTSPPTRQTVTSSPALPRTVKPKKGPGLICRDGPEGASHKLNLVPFSALGPLEPPSTDVVAPAEKGPIRVWALPGLVKISPTTARAICDDLGAAKRKKGPGLICAKPPPGRSGKLNLVPFSSRANGVWNGEKIGLFGARGEYVSYQLCIENIGRNALEAVKVRHGKLKGPADAAIGGDQIDLYENWYVQNREDQWQPAYCIPLMPRHALAIPNPKRELPNQRNQTVYVDIYIPKDAKPGKYTGAVQVEADGDHKVLLPVTLEVFDFQLPDRLSFWPELNAYNIPKQSHEYYRLAHQHRSVLNCWRWMPKLEGSGKNIRVIWDEYDRDAGPLLSGQAFVGNRRSGVPVECMYLPYEDSWPTPLSKKTYDYQGPWPGRGDSAEYITQHYLTAPYIGRALSDEYKEAFRAVQRQFVEHFREMGYTRTEMQCFYGGKVTHRIDFGANMWWTTDEPYHWDDWMALQYFCWWWTDGARRAGANSRRWTARADISRPQWQGRVLDGIVNEVYYGAGGFNSPAMVRRCRILAQDTGLNVRTYGGANRDTESNTQSVSALLNAWTDGADAYLPWQTLGSDKALDKGDRGASGGAALLVPGDRFSLPVVADMRLKAFRDGQQLIEYLVLLGRRHKLNREQIRAMLHEAVRLDAKSRPGAGLDNADSMQFAVLSPWQISQLRRRLAELIAR